MAALIAMLALPGVAFSSFSRQALSGTNIASTDSLPRYFSIVPGTAVQPGTATPIAAGAGATLAIDFGRVPDTRTINDVVRVTNITAVNRSLDLSLIPALAGLPGWEFSDGTTTKSIAPGATWQLRGRTNAAGAGAFTGFARFQITADAFLRLNQPITTRQAPLPVASVTAAGPDGTAHIQLSWPASTSTGVAGYNVYRATAAGGPYTKVNGSPVAGLTYDDTGVALGGNYWYRIRAVASGVSPDLESPDSPTLQVAVMTMPTAVLVPASVNNTQNWVSLATRANVTFQVAVPAGTLAGDIVTLTVTNGAQTLNLSQAATGGAQTLNFTGNNLTAWADGAMGTITMSSRVTRGAFVGPIVAAGAGKDIVIPATPTAARVIAGAQNPIDYVNMYTAAAAPVQVTSAAPATDRLEARLTSGAATAIGSAPGPGTVNVPVNAAALADTAVGGLAVAARRVDQAGNPSAWIAGTAATKDTVAPGNPNFAAINYTNIFNWIAWISGGNGAVAANVQTRIFDYSNATSYPTAAPGWDTANAAGNWGNIQVNAVGGARIFGFEHRDTAWNMTARICVRYTGSGAAEQAIACP